MYARRQRRIIASSAGAEKAASRGDAGILASVSEIVPPRAVY